MTMYFYLLSNKDKTQDTKAIYYVILDVTASSNLQFVFSCNV